MPALESPARPPLLLPSSNDSDDTTPFLRSIPQRFSETPAPRGCCCSCLAILFVLEPARVSYSSQESFDLNNVRVTWMLDGAIRKQARDLDRTCTTAAHELQICSRSVDGMWWRRRPAGMGASACPALMMKGVLMGGSSMWLLVDGGCKLVTLACISNSF
jgi:hypothetical protein